MAYLSEQEIYQAYEEASDEADQWRLDYPQYERLADNGLLDDLDENLPEVNDGSLAASLFKLAKRVIKKEMTGEAIALNRDEAWITKLANIYWNKKILPNARSKASPRRKWKDAVRKAAIYGGQPIITLFLTRGNYTGSDFIVPYAQDVKLEAGKDSDEDSDVIFWDVYYSKLQLENMLEQATQEIADGVGALRTSNYNDSENEDYTDSETDDSSPKTTKTTPSDKTAQVDTETPAEDQSEASEEIYNYWDPDCIREILASEPEEQRPGNQTPKAEQTSGQKKTGYHFFMAFQRGIDAPFMLCHKSRQRCVREWTNPDPTGDAPVHYLYCYQDFVNPYGIGIVKLAGGTQNVLDYMRQADILATQLGLRPPKQIIGDEDQVDEDSLVYAQDANWYVGTAKVERMELANGVYNELPNRIAMYQTSLQKMIPMGDTSISGQDSGDTQQSKTPAGVKLAAANLSIDDEDFLENVTETYAMVARSMINTQFANMQGTDLFKLSDDERDQLMKAGLQFPINAQGKPITNDLNIIWNHTRAEFDFEIDPAFGNLTSDEDQVTILQEVLKEMTLQTNYYLGQDGWKFNLGEAYYALFSKMKLENFNSIITKMTDEEKQAAANQPFPIIDPPQIRLTGQIPNGAMVPALAAGGVNVDPSQPDMQDQIDLGDIIKDPTTTPFEKAQIKKMAGITPDPSAQSNPDPNAVTPELALKADQQQHQQSMDKAKLNLEVARTAHELTQPTTTPAPAASTAKKSAAAKTPPTSSDSTEQAKIAQDHINQVMKAYSVDAHTAAAMLEAERQGYQPEEIVAAMHRNKPTAVGAK